MPIPRVQEKGRERSHMIFLISWSRVRTIAAPPNSTTSHHVSVGIDSMDFALRTSHPEFTYRRYTKHVVLGQSYLFSGCT